MNLLRKILFPVVPFYYVVTWLRNLFYDKGWFASKSYNFPVICVGNLSVGGTGKSPMIEYLISLLNKDYNIATLSRGYKRITKGFQIANETSNVATIGDEPFQFYSKFRDTITVAVDADRQHGIATLKSEVNPDVVLLDDAFQHRKVSAGFNIMLTTFDKLYIDDIVLPTGDLREPKKGAKRADIIVVTKCPENLDETTKNSIKKRLKLHNHQHLFFSHIEYLESLISEKNNITIKDLKDQEFCLITGIANPKSLVTYLEQRQLNFEHLNFSDHHNFTTKELEMINSKELVITTEKDYMRLQGKIETPLYYLPIKVVIDQPQLFSDLITAFVEKP